jgi:hypothetical protein
VRRLEQIAIRLFFPNLAMVTALIALFVWLTMANGIQRLLGDSDSGWHIRTGEMILAGHGIPDRDPFSFTRAGQPWVPWEWLTDVVMGALHQAWGLAGVVWFFALVIAFTIWASIQFTMAVKGDFMVCAVLLIPALTVSTMHWFARPHAISWLFFLITFYAAEKAPLRFRPWHGAAAFVFIALWTNLHGTFFMGLILFGLYGAGWIAHGLLFGRSPEWRARARWYLLVAACGLPATLINPQFIKLHSHLFGYLTNRELLSHVQEYHTFNLNSEEAPLVLFVYVFCFAGVACATASMRFGRALAMAAMMIIAMRHARGLPMAAFAVVPLANASIVETVRNLPRLRPWIKERLDRFFAYTDRLRELDLSTGGWLLAPISAIIAFLILSHPGYSPKVGFNPETFPVRIAARVPHLPLGYRLFSSDFFGGYLIYRYAGKVKVFFDGRSDFYGIEFMNEYLKVLAAEPGWQQVLDKNRITHALVPAKSAMRVLLETAGWTILDKDRTAVLFARPVE